MSEWPITDKEAARRLGVGWRGLRKFLDEREGLCTCLPGRIRRRSISRLQYEAIEAELSAPHKAPPCQNEQASQGKPSRSVSTSTRRAASGKSAGRTSESHVTRVLELAADKMRKPSLKSANARSMRG